MPEDAVYSGKKAEVWISFMEQETPGMVKIELASRLLISTRIEATDEAPEVVEEGSVGITVDGVVDSPGAETGSPFSPWVILGSVLGVLVIGGTLFFLVKRRQRV